MGITTTAIDGAASIARTTYNADIGTVTVPAGVEIAMREKGYTRGIFGWVVALPLALSM